MRQNPPVIDAHHHLWRFTAEEFGWLEGPLAPLRRNFLPDDLKVAMEAAGVDGAVAVQARQTVEETRWLLASAAAMPAIRGVVGWAPLCDRAFPGVLEELRADPGLKGLRHVVQAEPDPDFILRADFNEGIRAMRGTGLVYDLLVFERQLPQAIEFVDRHPGQQFVLDHLGKPLVASGGMEPWATHLRELARRPHVACKLSGLVTEADPQSWTPAQLRPYLETAVEAFGSSRLMAGSDWPVVLAGCAYARWYGVLREFFAAYTVEERGGIFGQNAVDLYGL